MRHIHPRRDGEPSGAPGRRSGGRPQPAAPISRGVGRRPVRLTRRGRIVVLALLLGLVTGLALLLAPAMQASPPAGPMRTIVVEPGDTLWSISTSALPSEDPYQAVDQVRRLNHMRDDSVYVGQQLTLPAAG